MQPFCGQMFDLVIVIGYWVLSSCITLMSGAQDLVTNANTLMNNVTDIYELQNSTTAYWHPLYAFSGITLHMFTGLIASGLILLILAGIIVLISIHCRRKKSGIRTFTVNGNGKPSKPSFKHRTIYLGARPSEEANMLPVNSNSAPQVIDQSATFALQRSNMTPGQFETPLISTHELRS